MKEMCKLIKTIVTPENAEIEWFYFDGALEWTGVSMVEAAIPVAPWAKTEAVEDVLRTWAQKSNAQSPVRGFELNDKDWARLAQCGRI